MTRREIVAGIFVGGRASRMGGIAKGLLRAPDGELIVVRTRRLLEAAGATVVLVGDHPAYASLGVETIGDDPRAPGPLGGVLSLLRRAGEGYAVAVACDMPRIDPGLLQRLLDAAPAPVVAPRRDGRWEPLFARYDAAAVLPTAVRLAAQGERKLQRLFDAAGAVALPMSEPEAASLVDWDAPDDVAPA